METLLAYAPAPMPSGDPPPVPTYTAEDDSALQTRIDNAPESAFPILAAPKPATEAAYYVLSDTFDELETLQIDIIKAFFSAIEHGHDDLVARSIAQGLVSPDVTSLRQQTPLLAAVHAGNLPMVSKLVALGASVNRLGAHGERTSRDVAAPPTYPMRTPLMVAAERGSLAIVRALMEDYKADDAVVAPDGSMALRLAAVHGHTEIVAYLPSRRGGAWLRWKTAHEQQMYIAKRALRSIGNVFVVFLWALPREVLYRIPKAIVLGLWRRRKRFGGWCKRQVTRFPGRVKRVGRGLWRATKAIPRATVKVYLLLVRVIKAIPGVVKKILVWLGNGLKKMGKALLNVLNRLFSFLHTAFVAITTFFRSITLKDVWNGFCGFLRTLFVEMPKVVYQFLRSAGRMVREALEGLIGTLGTCIYYIWVGLVWLATYVPKRIWRVVQAVGRSMGRGCNETLAYVNPKRM